MADTPEQVPLGESLKRLARAFATTPPKKTKPTPPLWFKVGCLSTPFLLCGGCLSMMIAALPSSQDLAQAEVNAAAERKHTANLRVLEEAKAKEEAKKLAAKAKEESDKLLTQSILWEVEFDKFLENAGASEIGELRVEGFTATVAVQNAWHFLPYQIRLQTAQNLWKQWARIASPTDVDKARLKLVDLNGNEVGGSRALGGSLLWVDD